MSSAFELGIGYVEDLAAFRNVEPLAHAAGVRSLAIKVQDVNGNPLATSNVAALLAGESSRLRTAGFVLGGWSCPRADPVGSAGTVSELVRACGLSFVVFETEWQYKTDGGGTDVQELLAPWRRLRPSLLTGCATEGGPPTTFNHAAAIAAECRLLPETYYLVHDASDAMTQARRLGWPAGRVHVAASGVEGHDFAESLLRVYRSRVAGFTHGVALWRADLLSADDYRLAELVAGDLWHL